MSTAIKNRLAHLEQQAGIVEIDRERLAVLDDADVTFYRGVMQRVARHPKGYAGFIKTLDDADLERLVEIEVKMMDDAEWNNAPAELREEWQAVRENLAESLAKRQERRAADAQEQATRLAQGYAPVHFGSREQVGAAVT